MKKAFLAAALLCSTSAYAYNETPITRTINGVYGTSQFWFENFPAVAWEQALGTAAAPWTTPGSNLKISRTESLTSAQCAGQNQSDCNAALSVYSVDVPGSTVQGTAFFAAAIGYQLVGPYNDTLGATFNAATYPSGVTATPVFAASGNTVLGLNATTFYAGTSVVFSNTGGALPTGLVAGVPYTIITASSTAATIGRLNNTGGAPTQATWTGAGTGTMIATQGTGDNKASGFYCTAKTYSPDGRSICGEINIINLTGADAVRNVVDGDGFFDLLLSAGGGPFGGQWNVGNAIQVTNDGKMWLEGFVTTGGSVISVDVDLQSGSTYGLIFGGNHTYQIGGNNWGVNGIGDIYNSTPDSSQATFQSTGAHAAYVQIGDAAGGQKAELALWDASTPEWEIIKRADNSFDIWDSVAGVSMIHGVSGTSLALGEAGKTTNLLGAVQIGGTPGVSCPAGLPSAAFQTSYGIVIHC